MNGERTAASMNIEQRLPTLRRDQKGSSEAIDETQTEDLKRNRGRFGSRQFGGVGIPWFPS
jgi:hypothetical protein